MQSVSKLQYCQLSCSVERTFYILQTDKLAKSISHKIGQDLDFETKVIHFYNAQSNISRGQSIIDNKNSNTNTNTVSLMC